MRMKILLACLGAWTSALAAGDFLPGENSGALARSFALPALGAPAVLLRGRTETRVLLDFTNEYVSEGVCSAECILLDGETARLRLSHSRGLGGGWDFRAELPLLDQDGGFLDSWIEEWHGWFGLPNGGREQRPDNRYEYRYVRNNNVLFEETQEHSGIGDVTLSLGRRTGRSSALRGMVKLPTGDEETLAGGNLGGALWFDAALPLPRRWDGYFSVGVSFNERGSVLPEQQNRTLALGGLGLAIPFIGSSRLVAQLYAHSRLYKDSELSALSRFGLPLTLGLQMPAGRSTRLDLGFQEDLSVGASPDFSAYLALTYRAR
jgi:hypothetical protein